jgi:hypothetical protein
MVYPMAEAWSDHEIRLALESYFLMMVLDESGMELSKADHRKRLEELLPGRSSKSIDFKWCNVSAALEEAGESWLDAYKPLAHYQERLRELTAVWLMEHPYTKRLLDRR